MAKKYKISEVKHILKEYNLTMIDEKEYKNSKSKVFNNKNYINILNNNL